MLKYDAEKILFLVIADNFSCSHGFMEDYIFHVMWGFEYFASLFLGEVTLGRFTVELGTHYV